jgi:hypothetical protein
MSTEETSAESSSDQQESKPANTSMNMNGETKSAKRKIGLSLSLNNQRGSRSCTSSAACSAAAVAVAAAGTPHSRFLRLPPTSSAGSKQHRDFNYSAFESLDQDDSFTTASEGKSPARDYSRFRDNHLISITSEGKKVEQRAMTSASRICDNTKKCNEPDYLAESSQDKGLEDHGTRCKGSSQNSEESDSSSTDSSGSRASVGCTCMTAYIPKETLLHKRGCAYHPRKANGDTRPASDRRFEWEQSHYKQCTLDQPCTTGHDCKLTDNNSYDYKHDQKPACLGQSIKANGNSNLPIECCDCGIQKPRQPSPNANGNLKAEDRIHDYGREIIIDEACDSGTSLTNHVPPCDGARSSETVQKHNGISDTAQKETLPQKHKCDNESNRKDIKRLRLYPQNPPSNGYSVSKTPSSIPEFSVIHKSACEHRALSPNHSESN